MNRLLRSQPSEPPPVGDERVAKAGEYLSVLQKNAIEPNFWVSEEYLVRAEAEIKAVRLDKTVGEVYQVYLDGVLAFPPVADGIGPISPFPGEGFIWSDFPGTDATPYFAPEPLDLEFIYYEMDFSYMDGGDWAVFRKNSRKWPSRTKGHVSYIPLPEIDPNVLDDLLIKWLSTQGEEEEIHDDQLLLQYLHHGNNRWGLFRDGELVGVNIFDYNYLYTNYRYSICAPEPFLPEYMRLLFYTVTPKPHPWVNDGGVLDQPSIEAFKRKMNPRHVRTVNSWRRREEQ